MNSVGKPGLTFACERSDWPQVFAALQPFLQQSGTPHVPHLLVGIDVHRGDAISVRAVGDLAASIALLETIALRLTRVVAHGQAQPRPQSNTALFADLVPGKTYYNLQWSLGLNTMSAEDVERSLPALQGLSRALVPFWDTRAAQLDEANFALSALQRFLSGFSAEERDPVYVEFQKINKPVDPVYGFHFWRPTKREAPVATFELSPAVDDAIVAIAALSRNNAKGAATILFEMAALLGYSRDPYLFTALFG